ncbi:MAG: tRNA pseudouridine(38-40) synthase TruA [Planctomycetota bacterium]|jgi:tRNA pseudouridine38-40 synthase|nr:tRNA pseudouridine(38-40) synthase TruA [Planctomycetota bacterium]
MSQCRATVEYDGSNYHGWQIQKNAVSVQAALERALKLLTGSDLRVRGAGRTDAGVHARGQTAAFPLPPGIPLDRLADAVNSRLPRDIAVTAVREVGDAFDPRRDCVRKQYSYSLSAGRPRPALDARRSWPVRWPLSPDAMRRAAGFFLGEHDFTSFCRAGLAGGGNVRTLERSEIRLLPPDPAGRTRLVYYVEARGFLYNMVRALVGALVAAGSGRFRPEDIPAIIKSRDRSAAGQSAPPHGLCLEWTLYPGDWPPPDRDGLF